MFNDYILTCEFESFESLYHKIIGINPDLPSRFNIYIWVREGVGQNDYIVTMNSGYKANNRRLSLIVNLQEAYKQNDLVTKQINPDVLIENGFNKKYERTLKKGHKEITYDNG